MKKIILAFAIATLGNVVLAQNTSNNDFASRISVLESATSVGDLSTVMNSLPATNDWQIKYTKAFASLQKAKLDLIKKSKSNLDTYADAALAEIENAKSLGTLTNEVLSEFYVLESIAHSFKFIKAPQERISNHAQSSSEALVKAESLNPNNPRTLMARAYRIYFLPDNYGGSKDKALAIFGEAKSKFTGTSSVDLPNWGAADANFFMTKRP